jgi:hypothetical protein
VNPRDRKMFITRLERIEKAVAEMKTVLDNLPSNGILGRPQRTEVATSSESQSYIAEWMLLKSRLMTASGPEELIEEFLTGRTKPHIKRLIQLNNLPVDPKASKPEQARQFVRLVAVSRTIQQSRGGAKAVGG